MYKWNEDKNCILKSTRGYSFENVLEVISRDGIVDNYKHPNSEQYPNQYIYIVRLDGYIHFIPYVIDGDEIFLKNIIPDRKLNKKYAKDKS